MTVGEAQVWHLRRNNGGGGGMAGGQRRCGGCGGAASAQVWRSCEHALVGGGAGLDDVEGVCGRVFALVPLGWLECAAVVEVGAYQLDVVGVV